MTYFRSSLLLLVVFLAAGCVKTKVSKALAEGEVEQTQLITKLERDLETKPIRSISWTDAKELMMRQNSGIQTSREALHEARRGKKDLWLSLVPRVGLFAGLSQQLGSFASFGSDDLQAQVRAGFNIPSPVAFYGRLYAAELSAVTAEWSHEADKRQAVAQLYRAFQSGLEEARLSRELVEDRAQLNAAPLAEVARLARSISDRERALKSRRLRNRLDLNRLLGTPGGNWKLRGGLPSISYQSRFAEMQLGRNFGQLGLKQDVARIEAAQLAVLNVKVRRWPNVTFGVGAPALYTRNGGSNGFDADDVVLFSGANRSFSLVDPLNKEGVRKAELRFQRTRAEMQRQLEQELVRIANLRSDYRALIQEERVLSRQESLLQRSQSTNPDVLIGQLEQMSQLRETRRLLRARKLSLDLQFWIWDDSRW